MEKSNLHSTLTFEERVKKIKEINPSFCLAKWLQVTIDLQKGMTHSCHHPKRHTIPLEEIKTNPSALHNTNYKKEMRKLMLEGTRPSECSYCWAVEDLGSNEISDRFLKSVDDWAFPHLEEVRTLPWDVNIAPRYLEVMFSSTCNLACIYCKADISSSIENEIKKYGAYDVEDKDHRISHETNQFADEENNPYVQAFWKWLPDIVSQLQVLRVTGGEPLLSPNTFLILDFLAKNKSPNLKLAINTNLFVSDKKISEMIEKVNFLLENKCIHSFELFTSIDSFGEQAAYMRQGLKFDTFLKHLQLVNADSPKTRIILMTTFNILSLGQFTKLLEFVLEKKRNGVDFLIDASHLTYPRYLSAQIADSELLNSLTDSINFMKNNRRTNDQAGFSDHEILKIERLFHWASSTPKAETLFSLRRDFIVFIDEFDRRYKTNFEKTFPEFERFVKMCRKLAFMHDQMKILETRRD